MPEIACRREKERIGGGGSGVVVSRDDDCMDR